MGDAKVVPVSGSLVEMKGREAIARDVANITALYTKVRLDETEDDKPQIVQAGEMKTYSSARMPYMRLSNIRQALGAYETDPTTAVRTMFMKLKEPANMGTLIYASSTIYGHKDLAEFRKPSAAVLAKYNKIREKDNRLPEIAQAYDIVQGDFSYLQLEDPNLIWLYYCNSLTARGGAKKNGALTKSYYRYDLPPSIIDLVSEVTDIIMLCKQFKYEAVRLEMDQTEVAKVLIANGVYVYCTALSSTIQKDKDPPGLYSTGKKKSVDLSYCIPDPTYEGRKDYFYASTS